MYCDGIVVVWFLLLSKALFSCLDVSDMAGIFTSGMPQMFGKLANLVIGMIIEDVHERFQMDIVQLPRVRIFVLH